jgi:hypothetical protein
MVEVPHFFNDRTQITPLGRELDAAGKLQEVTQNACEPIHLTAECFDSANEAVAFVRLERGVLQVLNEQLRIEANGRERVLYFVGQPAGHRTKFGEPLALPRFTLGRSGAALSGAE